jgi:NDP-sugar pyrophosphorylase family protein
MAPLLRHMTHNLSQNGLENLYISMEEIENEFRHFV